MDDLGEVVLTLKPLPDAIPAGVRLRRALKVLLRGFGLRCTSIGPAATAQDCIRRHRKPQVDPKAGLARGEEVK